MSDAKLSDAENFLKRNEREDFGSDTSPDAFPCPRRRRGGIFYGTIFAGATLTSNSQVKVSTMTYRDPYPSKQTRLAKAAEISRRKSLALNFTALALIAAGFLLHNWPI